MKIRRPEFIAVILIFLAVGALFLPALAGWRGIFHDDQAMDIFPWQYFLARYFQEGTVPLWEPDTWCGAKPFYARYYADTYYLPNWPAYLLSHLDDLEHSYLLIALLPLIFHYGLAGAGMFAFARRGLLLRTGPAFVTAWAYLFSPAFSYSYVWGPVVNVQAWLPWLLLAVVSMNRGFRPGKVIAGGGIVALMLLAAQPPHVGYGLLLAGLLALGLALRRLWGGEKRLFWRAPLQLAGALLLGLILSAVYWLPVLEGEAHTAQHLEMDYDSMTGGDGSMPPIYLATLFVPDLFGTVSGYNNRNWVESVTEGVRFWDANMAGGLLLFFLVLAGACLVLKRARFRRLRFWAIFSVLLWIFSILLMLGKHTPFYYLFYRTVPVLSLFPFPIRYRLLQVIATAWLAGLGVEFLAQGEWSSRGWPKKVIWGYLGLAFLAGLAALFGREGLGELAGGRLVLPGLAETVRRDNLAWFIRGPVLYYLAAGLLLVWSWRKLRRDARVRTVTGLVILETSIFALAAFYFCIFRFHHPQPQQMRSTGPSQHPMIGRVLGPLADFRDDSTLRWATDQPFHDNFARLEGSFALMGYDMKPLERRFKEAFEAAYGCPVDWPIYWEFPRPIHPQFLSNMSVGYLLDSNPRTVFPGGESERLESNPDFCLHRNPRPLPRAFVMDRVVACSEDEAMEELVRGDLRRGVFVDDSKQLAVSSEQSPEAGKSSTLTAHCLPLTAYRSFDPGTEEEYLFHFERLQKANPITRLDLGNPNRVEVDLNVTVPAILVLTEVWYPGWEARVDGEPAELLRVNYLQRGVRLAPGERRVEMVFRSRAWRIGAAVSLASWALLLIIVITIVARNALQPGR